MKMIKDPALAAKRPGGGIPMPAAKKTPPMALKKGGCVKMAKGGMARGFGAARSSANKFKGGC